MAGNGVKIVTKIFHRSYVPRKTVLILQQWDNASKLNVTCDYGIVRTIYSDYEWTQVFKPRGSDKTYDLPKWMILA